MRFDGWSMSLWREEVVRIAKQWAGKEDRVALRALTLC
jgi:hypothetical protein